MYCIVVKRGEFQQYDVLYKAFGARLPVIWDRRRVEGRDQDPQSTAGEHHSAERRGGMPPSWVALGFVVVDR